MKYSHVIFLRTVVLGLFVVLMVNYTIIPEGAVIMVAIVLLAIFGALCLPTHKEIPDNDWKKLWEEPYVDTSFDYIDNHVNWGAECSKQAEEHYAYESFANQCGGLIDLRKN